MTNVVDQSAWRKPTADLSNIYLAWWDSYLYNKLLALICLIVGVYIYIYIYMYICVH